MTMRGVFKRPKPPKQPAMVNQQETPTPTIDQAAQRAEDEMRLRRRKGRNRYQLTPRADAASPTVGTKTLTGQ